MRFSYETAATSPAEFRLDEPKSDAHQPGSFRGFASARRSLGPHARTQPGSDALSTRRFASQLTLRRSLARKTSAKLAWAAKQLHTAQSKTFKRNSRQTNWWLNSSRYEADNSNEVRSAAWEKLYDECIQFSASSSGSCSSRSISCIGHRSDILYLDGVGDLRVLRRRL